MMINFKTFYNFVLVNVPVGIEMMRLRKTSWDYETGLRNIVLYLTTFGIVYEM
jgi:hypothetical protein